MALLINRAKKWAYIHIPKTCGTTISSLLLKIPNTEIVNSHGSLNELKEVDGYFIFSFVRNPFTRLASWFEHYKKNNNYSESFLSFIEQINPLDFVFYSQEYFLRHGETKEKKVSFIGKYENFENDLKLVFKIIGEDLEKIPKLNTNKYIEKHPNLDTNKLYKGYFKNDYIKDWTIKKYKNDFIIFGYDMEI